jgi:hypothetical protein
VNGEQEILQNNINITQSEFDTFDYFYEQILKRIKVLEDELSEFWERPTNDFEALLILFSKRSWFYLRSAPDFIFEALLILFSKRSWFYFRSAPDFIFEALLILFSKRSSITIFEALIRIIN